MSLLSTEPELSPEYCLHGSVFPLPHKTYLSVSQDSDEIELIIARINKSTRTKRNKIHTPFKIIQLFKINTQ